MYKIELIPKQVEKQLPLSKWFSELNCWGAAKLAHFITDALNLNESGISKISWNSQGNGETTLSEILCNEFNQQASNLIYFITYVWRNGIHKSCQ